MNLTGKTTSHELPYRYVHKRLSKIREDIIAHREIDEAYREFFIRRGMNPPNVSSHVIEYSSLIQDDD